MRRSLGISAATCVLMGLLALFFICPNPAAIAQAASSPSQSIEALSASYSDAMHANDWARAVSIAQTLVQASASPENLRLLANAQLNSGAKQDALATYDRAVAAAAAEKPAEGMPQDAWKEQLAKIYIGKGNALLKLRSNDKALEAYNEAANLSANPGLAYFNVCAVSYNIGNMADAAAACRKSLQADPTRADAWFILGSVLYVDATTDAKGKLVISAEARHALEKYLELAPAGPHAEDVKAMLDMAAK